MNVFERFNQHSRKPFDSVAKSRYNGSKVSTGQALFNLNKTLPRREKSTFDATMRQNRLRLGENIAVSLPHGSQPHTTSHLSKNRAVLI